jgi:hypothetical protein
MIPGVGLHQRVRDMTTRMTMIRRRGHGGTRMVGTGTMNEVIDRKIKGGSRRMTTMIEERIVTGETGIETGTGIAMATEIGIATKTETGDAQIAIGRERGVRSMTIVVVRRTVTVTAAPGIVIEAARRTRVPTSKT